MAPNHTREAVIATIAAQFPHEHLATILAILELYGVESYERERERVHVAVLTLSGSNVDALLHNLARAKADYRDVLYWAEYPITPST